jgi:hypothetical protein
MNVKSLQALILVAAGIVALIFVKLMFDMSNSMTEMTGYIRSLSEDVSAMQNDMQVMNQSMIRMEQSIAGFGRAFTPAGQQFQQLNPADMMQQVMPGTRQPPR